MPRGGGGSRGGGGGGGGGGSRSYSTGRSSYSSSPPRARTPAKSQGQGQGHPGLMKQMAATAGGVVAGNLLAAAILGSARGSIPPDVAASCEDGKCQIPEDDPCAMELKNFVECAYRAQEITACDGYNTLLKECRRYTERSGKY